MVTKGSRRFERKQRKTGPAAPQRSSIVAAVPQQRKNERAASALRGKDLESMYGMHERMRSVAKRGLEKKAAMPEKRRSLDHLPCGVMGNLCDYELRLCHQENEGSRKSPAADPGDEECLSKYDERCQARGESREQPEHARVSHSYAL